MSVTAISVVLMMTYAIMSIDYDKLKWSDWDGFAFQSCNWALISISLVKCLKPYAFSPKSSQFYYGRPTARHSISQGQSNASERLAPDMDPQQRPLQSYILQSVFCSSVHKSRQCCELNLPSFHRWRCSFTFLPFRSSGHAVHATWASDLSLELLRWGAGVGLKMRLYCWEANGAVHMIDRWQRWAWYCNAIFPARSLFPPPYKTASRAIISQSIDRCTIPLA